MLRSLSTTTNFLMLLKLIHGIVDLRHQRSIASTLVRMMHSCHYLVLLCDLLHVSGSRESEQLEAFSSFYSRKLPFFELPQLGHFTRTEVKFHLVIGPIIHVFQEHPFKACVFLDKVFHAIAQLCVHFTKLLDVEPVALTLIVIVSGSRSLLRRLSSCPARMRKPRRGICRLGTERPWHLRWFRRRLWWASSGRWLRRGSGLRPGCWCWW
mmetsp:Transcript_53631/g.127787  ORF Transcript_53631/g.127787 Transcript_53631/m.127787 type:complete len:210 (+) Transcript_53631:163-792(+)